MRVFALSLLLLAACSNSSNQQTHLLRSNERLSEVELDTEQLKQALFEVRKEHEGASAKLEAYTSTLDALQKGCAEARAIEEMSHQAMEKALESAGRAEEISQLRLQVTDTLRLVEQTQKKIQLLESHLQSYWSKIDGLLSLKNDVARLKSDIQTPSQRAVSTYTVEPGDSLDFIARKFSVDPAALSELNNLPIGDLHPGQKLHIPSSRKED